MELFNGETSVDEIMSERGPLLDAEVEFVNPPEAIESGTRRGRDGFRGAIENKRAGLGTEANLELLELAGHGDEVFTHVEPDARGNASGVDVDGPPYGVLWIFRDDRVVRYEWSWDPDALLGRLRAE